MPSVPPPHQYLLLLPLRGSRGLMDRAWTCNLRLWVWISALAGIVHDWGETFAQGTEPPTAPRAPLRWLPTAPGLCALGWVKCRGQISLLVILCIIVYVTKNYILFYSTVSLDHSSTHEDAVSLHLLWRNACPPFRGMFRAGTDSNLLATHPPRFNGVLLIAENSADGASVLQQEVSSLLLKGAIEEIPSSDLNRGFFSRYFLVPKKDGGLRYTRSAQAE